MERQNYQLQYVWLGVFSSVDFARFVTCDFAYSVAFFVVWFVYLFGWWFLVVFGCIFDTFLYYKLLKNTRIWGGHILKSLLPKGVLPVTPPGSVFHPFTQIKSQ